MIIRRMIINDYEAVYSLWLSCKNMGLNNIDDSKEGINRFLNRNPDTCFVAEESSTIIGVIIVGNDGRRGYIYHTVVSPNFRNKGVATDLLGTALDSLKKIGIVKVALVVFDKNDVGNDFWENQEFTSRQDLVYRNKSLVDIIRIDT